MCSCAEAGSASRRLHSQKRLRALCLLLFSVVASGFVTGCYAEHPCGSEICDGRDNDCDGRVDEDYASEDGLYLNPEHCGACDLRCSDVLPSALATACVAREGRAVCEIAQCPQGQRMAIDGACVAELVVGCLPCTSDEECELRQQGARCISDALGSRRCAPACGAESDPDDDAGTPLSCPQGFVCDVVNRRRLCRPASGACECAEMTLGASFACEVHAAQSVRVCPGKRICSSEGLSECEPALSEACNYEDDDCDGVIDEGFTDAAERYVSDAHCGGCGSVCVSQGPHMLASCVATSESAVCEQRCEPGFVDRDRIANNGCECQQASARVPVVSSDQDCDGEADPIPELIFVSVGGRDDNDGSSPEQAVRTIARGMELGALFERTIVVARGVYRERVTLVAGITLVGGYSPDFTEHDAELYPVWIEAPASDPGLPVLRCSDIDTGTYVADITLIGSEATDVGQGSTTLLLAGCSSAVELHRMTVIAQRGADGVRGADSSERLAESSGLTLAALSGVPGGPGRSNTAQSCALLPGGNAGLKSCSGADVSGGLGGSARCAELSCSNADETPCGNAGCSDFTVDGVCDIAAARSAAQGNPAAGAGRGVAPGRAGETTFDAPTNHGSCSFCDDNPSLPRVGGDGGDGLSGEPGLGGAGCQVQPSLDDRGIIVGAAGQAGKAGKDGSGGGGGSAGAGYAVIAATSGSCESVPGAAGGGGGSGGCGAPGAGGGGGGGSSVAIAIRLRPRAQQGPWLDDVRVVTASGGDAGDGGVGASGGAGGSGGLGGISTFWCARNGGRGGDGGDGGDAGGGGGGCGGSSFGIFVEHDGSEPPPDAYVEGLRERVRVEVAGSAGRGGRGGFSPSHAGADGSPGEAAVTAVGRY